MLCRPETRESRRDVADSAAGGASARRRTSAPSLCLLVQLVIKVVVAAVLIFVKIFDRIFGHYEASLLMTFLCHSEVGSKFTNERINVQTITFVQRRAAGRAFGLDYDSKQSVQHQQQDPLPCRPNKH